jgi:hypothetical protein
MIKVIIENNKESYKVMEDNSKDRIVIYVG